MKRKNTTVAYLAFLTVKYDIHPDVLFSALLSAGEIGKAKCGPLSVERRGKISDRIYYLVKDGSEVVAQFPVSEQFLSCEKNPIWDFMEAYKVRTYRPTEPVKTVYSQIEDLGVGRRNVNLKAQVVEVSEPKLVNSRYGNEIRLAKALLKDDTGLITLCLWREKVDAISSGDLIEVKNAVVTKFRNERQLTLSRNGTLQIVGNAPKPGVHERPLRVEMTTAPL